MKDIKQGVVVLAFMHLCRLGKQPIFLTPLVTKSSFFHYSDFPLLPNVIETNDIVNNISWYYVVESELLSFIFPCFLRFAQMWLFPNINNILTITLLAPVCHLDLNVKYCLQLEKLSEDFQTLQTLKF